MTETYTFELTFTGLCIFTFSGGTKRNPDRVDVLLVDATRHGGADAHRPNLSFEGRNVEYASGPGFHLAPGSDGRLLGYKDMLGVSPLKVAFRNFTPPQQIQAIWRPDDLAELPLQPDRTDRSEEDWLDWVMALRRMNPETASPSTAPPFNGLKERVPDKDADRPSMAARVELRAGLLNARDFPMWWNVEDQKWEYVTWVFKKPAANDDGDPSETHAMAGSVVLSIPGIPVASSVVLSDEQGFVVLLAPRREPDARYQSVVRASVTNLPMEDDGSGSEPEYLKHFEYFYEPAVFDGDPPTAFRLPHKVGQTITLTNSFCPPTSHTEGS
jgi:hypothetical protein